MQAEYPKKIPTPHWDTLNIEYPTRKFPGTGESSTTIGHSWRPQPEILRDLKQPIDEVRQYHRDYNVTNELMESVAKKDYGYKHPETKRHNKHTSCTENHYIYPVLRRLQDRPPACNVFGTTEMKSSYTPPTTPARLVTDKDQFKHPLSLPEKPEIEPSFGQYLEPLDTTHDGFEKYLDPYLTTSRLHHRPYTADQLNRPSASKDIITYYTLSDTPWVWSRKPKTDWRLPTSRPVKSVYDREKFKQDCREIRTHSTPKSVPGTFRTEVRDNYIPKELPPESPYQKYEENIRADYQRVIAGLPTNTSLEHSTIRQAYKTENSQYGSGERLCSVIDPYIERNKRLERKSIRIR